MITCPDASDTTESDRYHASNSYIPHWPPDLTANPRWIYAPRCLVCTDWAGSILHRPSDHVLALRSWPGGQIPAQRVQREHVGREQRQLVQPEDRQRTL